MFGVHPFPEIMPSPVTTTRVGLEEKSLVDFGFGLFLRKEVVGVDGLCSENALVVVVITRNDSNIMRIGGKVVVLEVGEDNILFVVSNNERCKE